MPPCQEQARKLDCRRDAPWRLPFGSIKQGSAPAWPLVVRRIERVDLSRNLEIGSERTKVPDHVFQRVFVDIPARHVPSRSRDVLVRPTGCEGARSAFAGRLER